MKIYKLLYLLLGFTLASCSNPFEDEKHADFFSQSPQLEPSHLELDEVYGQFMAPNAFTPGKERCSTFFIVFEYSNLEGTERSSFDYFKIFDQKKKLVKSLDDFIWDGTNDEGEYAYGEFSYEGSIMLAGGQQVKATGGILSIGDCIASKYDTKYMRFSDQMHPRLGFVFPTGVQVDYCEE